MRIDSHHSSSERYPLAHLESILKRNRFEGSVMVSADGAAPACAFVRGTVVRIGMPLGPAQIAEVAERPWVKGVCLRVGSEIPGGLEELERRDAPLDLEGGLSLVPRIAGRFPGLRIVLDHLGAPEGIADFGEWARQVECAARIPQVYCKVSGLFRLGQFARSSVRHALDLFGPRRLMFGSDWPHSLPEHSWKANLAAFTQAIGAQPVEVREEMLGGTAARFYGL